ncbi:DUF2470 domain-containing protein [Hoyosella rhizosphaerae]|uniref:Pyridoxamine 5'-phosphate oxidase n=1 Tax=Hoyosella rhizosphaerae TaxID=1755582 RepID=A0A916U083_9ACTN|nr:DUF2470 domain-containing protein [Hoyosella rhizosphaerae]MBN4926952.1 DUF2470 domain-containing protein [Hoyosella rhizosphaerae]GGC55208.1 pyridoxamine 5'-phosphate oxidase [Hoyosella rhizosphaerae]
MPNSDHGTTNNAPTLAPPLTAVAIATQPSAAEEARTIVASTNFGTLATLTSGGDPWASFVTYGTLHGDPVLCVSTLAEHGRNLADDPRASIAVVSPEMADDPLATSRVTLAGVAERPTADQLSAARDAHVGAVAAAKYYVDYSDFQLWVLRVQRVRWVGGYGRMASASGVDYSAAQPDPVMGASGHAVAHLNADHADALLEMARNLGGYPDATQARCVRADRYGLSLTVTTPRGWAPTRVGFPNPIASADELRSATIELVRLARLVKS